MDHRPLTLADSEQVAALVNRFERFWDLPLVTPAAQVEDDFTEPFVDLALDSRGYWIGDSLVAYGLVWHRPSGERLERAYLQGVVDPDWRGQGIGRHLFGWEMERARESLAVRDPSLPWYIRADEWDWVDDAHRLYRRFGLRPVRYNKEMIRALSGHMPVEVPIGTEIVLWDRERDEDARQVQNEAFADHWGSTPIDAESFRHRLEAPGHRLDISFMALAGDEVVGICLNAVFPDDEAITGRREGWVMTLGVKGAHRKKGIAGALITMSLNAFVDEGMTHSMIGVDSENPTGAFRLYEGLGYEAVQGSITSELRVNPPGS